MKRSSYDGLERVVDGREAIKYVEYNVFGVDCGVGGRDIVNKNLDLIKVLLHRTIFHLDLVELVLELNDVGSIGGLKATF